MVVVGKGWALQQQQWYLAQRAAVHILPIAAGHLNFFFFLGSSYMRFPFNWKVFFFSYGLLLQGTSYMKFG